MESLVKSDENVLVKEVTECISPLGKTRHYYQIQYFKNGRIVLRCSRDAATLTNKITKSGMVLTQQELEKIEHIFF